MRRRGFFAVLLVCFFASVRFAAPQTPTPTATVFPTVTPTPTSTPGGSPLPTPSATPTASAIPTASATPTASALPTASATPTPSATPGGQTPTPTVSPGASGQLLNLSTRAFVQTGNGVLIGGFVISGSNAKTVLIRAIGPSLRFFGVQNALANPSLELFDLNQNLVQQNDDWRQQQEADISATGMAPTDDRESALLITLQPSSYTAVVGGTNNTTGVALVEIFDLEPDVGSVLTNISSRGFVGTDDNVLIGGFIIGPQNSSANVLVRARGPSLVDFNVTGTLQDPTLTLFNANGVVIAANDNWRDAQESVIQSSGLAPTDNREPAIFASLAAGGYTAIVRGRNDTTGIALVEIYRVD
jgi:hypothetical protein